MLAMFLPAKWIYAQDVLRGASALGIYNLPATAHQKEAHPGTSSYGSTKKKGEKGDENRFLAPYLKKNLTNPQSAESISTRTNILVGYITSDGMIRDRIGTPALGRIPNFKSDQHTVPVLITGHLDPDGKVTNEKGLFIGRVKFDGTICDIHGFPIGTSPHGNRIAGALLILGTHVSQEIF